MPPNASETLFLLRSSKSNGNYNGDTIPYTHEYHSQILRIQKEPPGVWYSIDLTHHLLSSSSNSVANELLADDEQQANNNKGDLKQQQQQQNVYIGNIKEYCFAMTDCHRWYHGLAGETTPDNDASVTAPVRTIAIRIRPDVLCGAVMDAINYILGDMGADILKRQGGHLKASLNNNNCNNNTDPVFDLSSSPSGSGNTPSYDLDAQLCTCASPKCERILLIRIYHSTEQTTTTTTATEEAPAEDEAATDSTTQDATATNDNAASDNKAKSLSESDFENILANFRKEQQNQQKNQQGEQQQHCEDHRHCANLHLREASALVRWSKKCQLLIIPISLREQQRTTKELLKSKAKAEPKLDDSQEEELQITQSGSDPAAEPPSEVVDDSTTASKPESSSQPGQESNSGPEQDQEHEQKQEQELDQEQEQEQEQDQLQEQDQDQVKEQEPEQEPLSKLEISPVPKSPSDLGQEVETTPQVVTTPLAPKMSSIKAMPLAQPYASSYILQNYLACPSVLGDINKENKTKTNVIATCPSLSPQDWPVICASWSSITNIWEELQDRELTFASLRDCQFGTFPALPTLDVQYCSQLEMFSKQEMKEQLTIHEAELERYAEQEETMLYRGWALLSGAAQLYKVRLPDKPIPLPLESYPIDFVPPQSTCPPWGGKVMEAMNRVTETSHEGGGGGGDKQQPVIFEPPPLPPTLQPQLLEDDDDQKESNPAIINGEIAITNYSDPLLPAIDGEAITNFSDPLLPPSPFTTETTTKGTSNTYRQSSNSAETAVQLVWGAFQAQHGEEQSALLDRKNAQVIDRLARMQAHQRECIRLLDTCTHEEAIRAADEFFARVQPEKLTEHSCTSRTATREVPLLSCKVMVGNTNAGTCYITSSQILITTSKWMTKGSRRSTLFFIQEVDLQVVEEKGLLLYTSTIVVKKQGEEVFSFQPLRVSATQLIGFVDTLRKLFFEDPLVIPTQMLRSPTSSSTNGNVATPPNEQKENLSNNKEQSQEE